jgi:hypothetical protein
MGLQLSISNIVQLFSLFAPLFLAFFLIMVSVFNQNIKGLIYLGGLLIASVINLGLSKSIFTPQPVFENKSLICDLMDMGHIGMFDLNYSIPAYNSMFISFTLIYLLMPMISNNNINFYIISMIVTLLVVDAYVKVTNFCTSWLGIGSGIITGIILGGLWFIVLKTSGYESLLFFNDLTSNNVVCKRPENQTFKCSVYKNGQLLGDI